MILILFGPPGAGKGTQAQRLEHDRGMIQISTGMMFRSAIAAGSTLGQKVKAILDSGGLVPDDLTVAMLADRIKQPDCQKGFILDGFPRTLPQAEALDKMLADNGLSLTAAIQLKVDESALTERIVGRYTCAKCGAGYHDKFKPTQVADVCDECGNDSFSRRPDDKAEVVGQRFAAYHAQTEPLLPYYKAKDQLYVVDGMADMAEVARQIDTVLAKLA